MTRDEHEMNAGTSLWFEMPGEHFFFRSHRAVSLFFLFLFFCSNLIDFCEIQVTWDMREARGTSGLIQNLR